MIDVIWTVLKSFVDSRSLSIQFIEADDRYFLWAFDGPMFISCQVMKDGGADVTAFEASYKAAGNRQPSLATTAFSSKVFGTKKLFARNTGFQQALAVGANIVNYTATYPWCKILGVEVVGGETGDYADFRVYDTPAGTYSGVPNLLLNQFAYSVNIPKDYYQRVSQFDADLYAGMIIRIDYTSVSAKTVGFNLVMNEVK
jgi:hypothetical protein